jgi:acetyl-CoA acyltransferase
MAGIYDIVVASGVESMTRVPMGSSFSTGPGKPFGDKMRARYHDSLVPQGISAEIIAERWDIGREELDRIAYDSHLRAATATDEGRFDSQIIPIEVRDNGSTTAVTRDEGIRPTTTMEALAALQPAFQEDGKITAGNSSQITDGAASLLIMSEARADELGLRPKARFVSFSVVGTDPISMLTGPIPATEQVLAKAGLEIGDIGLFEINEAFASVIGAWLRESGADWSKVNVNGGAIALGHPLGASGARLMTNLVHEMERTGTRYGLQAMCEGGGTANGTIIELMS